LAVEFIVAATELQDYAATLGLASRLYVGPFRLVTTTAGELSRSSYQTRTA
jgi:hypothetical protein